jgi:hypothetical protein
MATAKSMHMLKLLSMTLKGPVSGWVAGGLLLAVTGFAP